MPGPHTPIDFAALADALLQRVHSLLAQWLPGGHMEGHEYVGPSRRSGGVGDSLKVNTTNGRWAYFAGDDEDSGGDLISLYAWLNNVGQGEAAKQLMDELGWQRSRASAPPAADGPPAWHDQVPDDVDDAAAAAPMPSPAPAVEAGAEPAPPPKDRWVNVLPVPPHAKAPARFVFAFKNEKLKSWQELEATRVWEYRFERELFGYVCRFERYNSDGVLVKDTVPYTWCEDTRDARRGQRWHWKTWGTPRPLYVPATLLSGDPTNVPVVIVEGEKCAEAGHQLLGHEFDFVSWPGGARAWALARWSWLMGRTVYLWPDCDAARVKLSKAEREANVDPATKPILPEAKQPGMQAMVGIGQLLLAEHACTVLMCPVPRPGAVAAGWDIADAIAEGWDAARVRDFIRSARPFTPPDEAVRAKAGDPLAAAADARSTPSKAAAEGGDGDDADHAWRPYLLRSGSGAVRNVRENIVVALDGLPGTKVQGIEACAGLIGFNEFSNTIQKHRATPWGTPAGDWLETDELQMGDWLVREHGLPSMPRGALEEAVMVVSRRHSFHPLRARMEGLRGQWDKQERLDTWLRLVCLEEDEWDDRDPLVRYLALAGRWFVMGMVARVMPEKREGARVVVGPGTKFDYMLVFEGPQGWGKSSAAAVLGGEYFADTGLDLEHKDSLMNIQGVWVYEWSELENLNKQEVGAVKRFVSSPTDRFRATFDRRPAKYPRQVVFIGTTNESHYLTDPTGNRRFWPVRVTRPPDLVWLRANLEQLLAEAVHRVDAGERFWPTREEQKLLFDPQQQARTVESGMESAVRTLLYDESQKVMMGDQNGTEINEIGMAELLKRIGYSTDKQTDAVVKKAGAVMHSLGWTVRRTSQPGRPRVYVRPKNEPRTEPGASPGSDPGAPGAPGSGADDAYPF